MAVTLLGYLENLILYQFGAYACFDLKTRMPWIQIAGAGMCALLFYVSDVPSSITSYGVMLCVVFFALKEEWRKRFWHLGVLFILVSGMGEIVEIPWEYLIRGVPTEWMPDVFEFTVEMGTLLSIGGIRRTLRDGRSKKSSVIIQKMIPGIFIGTIFCLFLTIVGLQYAYDMTSNGRFHIYVICVSGGGLILTWLLGVTVSYVRDMNQRLELANEQKEQLYQAEKEYYRLLLKREEDTRRFRHDLANHMVSLQELADEEEWGELHAYLKSMDMELKKIQGKRYRTGNKILDALSTYLLAELSDDVKVRFVSHLDAKIRVDSEKLCTIYGNLLKNAVEGVKRQPKDSDGKRISVELWSDSEWVKMKIKNSVSEKMVNVSQTSKQDQRNHGFGMKNVRGKVKELRGDIFFTQNGKEFGVEAALPNKTTV